ncbi:MAG: DUF58 domain-containing protein [Acidobacteria bacterium]|nr:DUF58 domain-containing protein [Acidobacteriota bacterium]
MLSPELAEELYYIEIAASRRIRSMRFGQSRSPIRGVGYEFETHLKYEVGEDLRRVDWNVSARMQELYLKRQFEEKEITVFLMADVSRSMYFSTAAYSKRIRMLQVAATLGFSAVSDGCHFGVLAFSDRVEAYEPPRKGRGHVWRTMDRLYSLQPERQGTNWETALRFLRSRIRRMAIVFLLSDFVTGPEAKQLAELPDFKVLARKHDVIPIVFEDQLETDLPPGHGTLRFRSPETHHEMLLSLSWGHRRQFEAYVEQRKNELRSLFFSLGMECLFLQVGEPFMDPLMMLFERRRKI